MSDTSGAPYYIPPEREEPAIRVTMTITASPHRQIGFETVVAQGLPANEFDELVDRMAHVADRQQAKIEFVEHQKQLTILRNLLAAAARDYAETSERFQIEAGGANSDTPVFGTHGRVPRLSKQQTAHLDVLKKQIEEYKTQIATREETMARCRLLIDGDSEPLAQAAE
jgi:hypothetical protein